MKPPSRLIIHIAAIFFIAAIALTSCRETVNPVKPNFDKGDYSLSVKYDSIRIYNGGGGVFLFSISPNSEFRGRVKLSVEANSLLAPKLFKNELSASDTVGEITLAPSGILGDEVYFIKLKLEHNNQTKEYVFRVHSYNWGGNYEDAIQKLELFKSWIEVNRPEYKSIFESPDKLYSTYPETLIVEHYTFLSNSYEVRLCYHVTHPQDSWAKLLIRRRGSLLPELALGTVYPVRVLPSDITEYPTLYGY